MIEVGKLYRCSEYFLLLFPDKETAGQCTAVRAAERDLRYADDAAAYWTRELGKPVSYCNPETPLLVLSVKEQYIEVLAEDKKGWIINIDWLDIGEIVDAAA
jgi:hypothetical protein